MTSATNGIAEQRVRYRIILSQRVVAFGARMQLTAKGGLFAKGRGERGKDYRRFVCRQIAQIIWPRWQS